MNSLTTHCSTAAKQHIRTLTPLSFTVSSTEQFIHLVPVTLCIGAQPLFQSILEDKSALMDYFNWPRKIDALEDVQLFLQRSQEAAQLGESITYLIQVEKDDTAGIIALSPINWSNHQAYFACWLSRAYRGKGIMTHAIKCLLRCYASFGIRKFFLCCSIDNTDNQRLAIRSGFDYVGTRLWPQVGNEAMREQYVFQKQGS